jgi:hypothetical protein
MTRRLRHGCARFARIATLLLLAGSPRAAHAALQINEILAGPARDWNQSGDFSTRDDEWVELRNTGPDAIDLSGYLITDGDRLPRFVPQGTLASDAIRLVYGRDSFDWERAHGFPAFGLSLGNTGDAVMLWQVVGPDTVLVDSYTYKSHEAAADRSVGRMPESGTWSLFDSLNPYTGTTPPTGNGCEPSPGAPNLCVPTPARETTWGRLKSLYR